jgi:hypothetical protein
MKNLADFLMSPAVQYPVLLFGIAALIIPGILLALFEAVPAFIYTLLTVAIVQQIPKISSLAMGSAKWAPIAQWALNAIPAIYLFIFFVGLMLQIARLQERASWRLALLSSLALTPILTQHLITYLNRPG